MRRVGGADSQYNPVPYPQVGNPQTRIIIMQRFSRRSESSKPHVRPPQPRGPAPGRQTPRAFGFEDQKDLILGVPKN